MSDRNQPARKLPVALINLTIFTVLGIDLYWLFTASGPLGWLAKLEAHCFRGRWYPTLTFLVLIVVEAGLALGVVSVLNRLGRARGRTPAVQ
jgi:hypothetical protein